MTKTYKVIPIEDYGVVVEKLPYRLGDKIIGSIGKRLDGVPLIELVDVVEQLWETFIKSDINNGSASSYHEWLKLNNGYKANTNKYSEEDIKLAYLAGWDMGAGIFGGMTSKDYLQSLQKQPIPTEVELVLEEKTSEQIQKELGIYGHDEGLTEKEYQHYIKHNSVVKITNKETNTITAVNYKTQKYVKMLK